MDSGIYDAVYREVSVPADSADRTRLGSVALRPADGLIRSAAASFGAYARLAKPRAILPHFLTSSASMFLAAGGAPPVSVLVFLLLGGGGVAAAANILNSVLDRDIDSLMERTRGRPLPSGVVRTHHALALASVAGLAGVLTLGALVSWVAAVLAMVALAYYVLVYTALLRRRTYWSAIICSGIGAMPVIMGWTAITDRISLTPILLSAMIVLWTVPHFWALALFRREDYARAGLRIVPETGVVTWIGVCSLLLVAVSVLLVPTAHMGVIYVGTASVLGAGLLFLNLRVRGQEPAQAARMLYGYSILYIAVLFGAMIVDRMVRFD